LGGEQKGVFGGTKKGWGRGDGNRGFESCLKNEKQKREKVLRSKRIEKARTQRERQKGEKVPRSSRVEMRRVRAESVMGWEAKGGKSTTKYIGGGGSSLKMSTGCAPHCVETLGLLYG
jgi:hypothetical protein